MSRQLHDSKWGEKDTRFPAFSITTKHHLWIDRWESKYILCGPMWRSLCEAYDVAIGDTLIFDYDEELKVFRIEVISDGKESKQ